MEWELWDLGPEATFALRRNRILGRTVVTWGLGGLWNGDLGTWGLGDWNWGFRLPISFEKSQCQGEKKSWGFRWTSDSAAGVN